MIRAIIVLSITAGCLSSHQAPANVVITSNDFNSFAAAVQNAAPGTTFNFNLGSNSTITFTHNITVPSGVTFEGGNAVTFDGGGSTLLFYVPSTSSVTFSGFTFQNAGGIDANSGAIISNGQLTVTGSRFFHNHAANNGGAILGNMRVSNCVFAFNDAGNTGGALAPQALAPCLIENSTFYANHAGNVGGAICGGVIGGMLLNDTIYGNSCGNVGGGVENDYRSASLSIQSCLIAGNMKGPSQFSSVSDVDFSGAVVATSSSLIGSPSGNNLVSGVNGNIIGNGTSIGVFPIASLLGPLQDNGGPTQTMALLNFGALTNPAIDAGSNPDNLQFDQRGSPFARTVGAGADIGAFEFGAVPEIPSVYLALVGAVLTKIALSFCPRTLPAQSISESGHHPV